MLTVYNCIANEHDLRLVALAAAICALASWTAISLLHHVRRSHGRTRLAWLGVAAASTGFGIWATHFIAMLAFSPGLPTAYNITLTFLSLMAAILLTALGLAVATDSKRRAWLGGHCRRRHCRDALHRHGGIRGRGPHHLGSSPC